jgi:SAM-dependent MidA family methyltransferase
MQESKMIRFSEYFERWLYSSDGYYSKYKKIGKDGDFFTSVSTSKLFGGSIAKRILTLIDEGFLQKDVTIVEVGAHHGYLLADVIQFIYTLRPALLKTLTFSIVERYESLREQQKNYLFESFGDEISFKHYNSLEQCELDSAFILANEIFDAFPCELVYTKQGVLHQGFVKDDKILFEICKDEALKSVCLENEIVKGEVSLGFENFAKVLSQNIKHFEFVTFDYGDFYPRNDFSCRIYEKHKVLPLFDEKVELKDLFKKTDITYDVNFSYLEKCFKKQGLSNIIYETQLKALVRFGIIELLEIIHKNANERTYLSETNKVKTLLEPTGMGDRFKLSIFRQNKNREEKQ